MDIVIKLMRDTAMCKRIIKEKFPGLPNYDCPNLNVYRILAFEPITSNDHPSSYDIEKAEELRKLFEVNSLLAQKANITLDWLYDVNSANHYLNNIDEFLYSYALYCGEEHSFAYILDDLKKKNGDLENFNILEDGTIRYTCWKEEIDISDKWCPSMKKVYYFVDVENRFLINYKKFLKTI
ncbi:hypothetical protein [Bullifex porci]|uniref:hypothetical protein n=1 Tax=Bullifex porci TaxID=2606638 RepID=UPI0023F1D2FF|nr:hypothetical protein [Bullifex porci]MDD7256155.1 hypothetical protein [Bullifex porci]MDY2740443.1 hypothetical protein [Bullifex porci]